MHRTCRVAQEPHAADALAVTPQRPGRQHGPRAGAAESGGVAFVHLSRAPQPAPDTSRREIRGANVHILITWTTPPEATVVSTAMPCVCCRARS